MQSKLVHIVKVTGVHGTEKHLLSLVPELCKNYAVSMIVLIDPACPMNDYLKSLQAQGASVYPVRISRDIDPACFFKIFRLLRQLRPALVHTHLIHGDTYGIAAAALAGVAAIVSTRHNDDTFRQTIALRALNRLINRKIRCVIAISDWIARFAHEVEAVPQEKIFTIHYGQAPLQPSRAREIVRRELGFGPEHIVLGIIARLIPQKGHRCLIDAFSQASTRDSRLRLLIAGDGELRDSLRHYVSSLHLDGIVAFAGYRTDVPELLASLDIFVHPSLWEGFGLAILEAMAMARPVIATRASAIPELVEDGMTGLLVPPADSQSLTQAMLELSRDELLRQKFGRAARERWQNLFSVERMITKTTQLYDTLLRTKEHEEKAPHAQGR